MLDVLLVGRTKMLRLHSCLWLENNTGMRLEPCLSLGSYCSTPVVLGPGDKLDSLQRLHLRVRLCCGSATCMPLALQASYLPTLVLPCAISYGDWWGCLTVVQLLCCSPTILLHPPKEVLLILQPLKPKEGRFLPAAAALGGLLFLAPEGHLPAQHDVLRLQHDGPSLPILRQQQGYISCEPKPEVCTALSLMILCISRPAICFCSVCCSAHCAAREPPLKLQLP
jgi:hypothetical protein